MEITVGIDFCDDGLEQFSVDTVAHDGEDGLHHGRRNAAFLVVIEAVEHFAQHCKQQQQQQQHLSERNNPSNEGEMREMREMREMWGIRGIRWILTELLFLVEVLLQCDPS